ncbi:type I restriction-modification system subunit M N-terminal domain-containing protein [Anaerococcus sp.]|uniref:type I restriction-modification system subunit M N-terminal domain-containing protein n=1 Tax=Anaerococcus sp. TaxID=1872515 RepID=UPI0028FF6FBF|nr:type I restriction-modification system subunit M N-terminal domain-containing protein [Anaerococcus sp.]MDU2598248.1 type I restriction-modification system subunit M N-terminal domain-containing protein [Anaerococcus sp.]
MEKTNNLYQKLWSASDDLRNFMDANEYKNYLLGIIFYKYLSDKQLKKISNLLELETDNLVEIQKKYEKALDSEDADLLLEELKYEDGFVIKAQYTFTNLIREIDEKTFQLDDLKQAFNDIERSDENFRGLFDDVDLYSNRLGKSLQDRNKRIANVMKQISAINLADYSGDILGDAYECMISNFASESGKKAGEFYTPQEVSRLMAMIVMDGKENVKGYTVYEM